uniref:Uncharacterized protein n=1 Tax=Clandestinovirus TaxID=2831644 RepID=A0A8F8PK73_9VIRU|nr:hypothetical protein KOM_12_187 [Clandestinovirus]
MNETEVVKVVSNIKSSVLGVPIGIQVHRDKIHGHRLYIQAYYDAPCTKTQTIQRWTGRKWYLSSHMTDDEVVKTAWCAVEAAVKHEAMEGFTYAGKIVFNPHVHYSHLIAISDKEIFRAKL